MEIESKICSKCKFPKPISEFKKRADLRHLFVSHCNACVKATRDAKQALKPKKERVFKKIYLYKGKYYSSGDLQKEFNVNPHKLKNEIKKCKSVEESIAIAMNYGTRDFRKYEYNGIKYSRRKYIALIKEKTGLKVGTLISRIRKGWSIEKLMLPDTIGKPVYQYDLKGNFIQEHHSISQAVRNIRKKRKSAFTGNISKACIKKGKTASGCLWRYADEISDKNQKLVILKKTKILPEGYTYLRRRYSQMMTSCYTKAGKYFNHPKIKVCEEWYKNFQKFYDDLLPLYREAKARIQEYKFAHKRRIKNTRKRPDFIWISRYDKTEGFLPLNMCFTTPNWCMRYRPNSYRVNIETQILFVPQICDILKEQGNYMCPETITGRIRKNRNILAPNRKKLFRYKGNQYSAFTLSKMFDVPYSQLYNHLKSGLSIKEALERIKTFKRRTIIYGDKNYRPVELRRKIMLEYKPSFSEETVKSRIKLLMATKNEFTDEDIKNIALKTYTPTKNRTP